MSFSLIVRSVTRKISRQNTTPNAHNLFRITNHQYTLALLHVLKINRVPQEETNTKKYNINTANLPIQC
jgi:hypothetical protein